MANAPLNYGVTALGNAPCDELYASARIPRTFDVVVASGQGELAKGTMMSKNAGTGKYEQYDGDVVCSGILNEDIDATDGDVNTYLCFDCDVNLTSLFAGTTTINLGLDHTSLINIMENQ